MSADKLWVVSYDISDNRRRRRIAAMLEDDMTRVQYSVFEGRLSDARMTRLVNILEAAITNEDSLRVYCVGKVGERKCQVKGAGIPIDNGSRYWLF